MSKTTNRIITALFSVFIGGFFLLNLLRKRKPAAADAAEVQLLFPFLRLFCHSF